jgi:ABC-type lipoprotein export system ATPase subunit
VTALVATHDRTLMDPADVVVELTDGQLTQH